MEIEGFIIERLQLRKTRTKEIKEWVRCWSKKIYDTIEIAEDAYKQRPDCYKQDDLQVRIVTLHRGDMYTISI